MPVPEHLHLYREHHIFGAIPSFRNASETIYRFHIPGQGLVTASRLLQDLQDNWIPVALPEVNYKLYHMANDFKPLLELEKAELLNHAGE